MYRPSSLQDEVLSHTWGHIWGRRRHIWVRRKHILVRRRHILVGRRHKPTQQQIPATNQEQNKSLNKFAKSQSKNDSDSGQKSISNHQQVKQKISQNRSWRLSWGFVYHTYVSRGKGNRAVHEVSCIRIIIVFSLYLLKTSEPKTCSTYVRTYVLELGSARAYFMDAVSFSAGMLTTLALMAANLRICPRRRTDREFQTFVSTSSVATQSQTTYVRTYTSL